MDGWRQLHFLQIQPVDLWGGRVEKSHADQRILMLWEVCVFGSDRHGFFVLCVEFRRSDLSVFFRS